MITLETGIVSTAVAVAAPGMVVIPVVVAAPEVEAVATLRERAAAGRIAAANTDGWGSLGFFCGRFNAEEEVEDVP